jgi:hypothetical protein
MDWTLALIGIGLGFVLLADRVQGWNLRHPRLPLETPRQATLRRGLAKRGAYALWYRALGIALLCLGLALTCKATGA